MISQMQWIIASCAIMYIIGVTWSYGFLSTRKHTSPEADLMTAFIFPIYFLGTWILYPIHSMGKSFGTVRQEKKIRIEALEKEAQANLEQAEQELNKELNQAAE